MYLIILAQDYNYRICYPSKITGRYGSENRGMETMQLGRKTLGMYLLQNDE